MKIEKLTDKYLHLTHNFTCGNIVIDNFLKNGNALDENQGITYIMLSDDCEFILGYYNIEVGRVDQIEYIGETANIIPMGGTININYLAIHKDYQHTQIGEVDGQKIYLGDYLLHDCEAHILKIRKYVGVTFITLYSTEQGYQLYHGRNSYEHFEEDMSTFVKETDISSLKLYKCIDDLIF